RVDCSLVDLHRWIVADPVDPCFTLLLNVGLPKIRHDLILDFVERRQRRGATSVEPDQMIAKARQYRLADIASALELKSCFRECRIHAAGSEPAHIAVICLSRGIVGDLSRGCCGIGSSWQGGQGILR